MGDCSSPAAAGLLLTGAAIALRREPPGDRFTLRLGERALARISGQVEGARWRAGALRVRPGWRGLGVEELLLLRLGERLRLGGLCLSVSVAPTRLAALIRSMAPALAGESAELSSETARALLGRVGSGEGRSAARLAQGALALRRRGAAGVEPWCPEAARWERLGFALGGAETRPGPRGALGVSLRFDWSPAAPPRASEPLPLGPRWRLSP